jgi:hypothetical protein
MKATLNEAPVLSPIASPEVTPEVLASEFTRNLGQISRQSAVFFLGALFTLGAGYLVKVYVARVLGAELLGVYALGMTMLNFVQMAGMLGLHGTAPRFVAVYKATGKFDQLRGYLTRSTVIIVFLNIVLSVGLVLSGNWITRNLYHAPELAQYIPLFGVLAVLGAVNVFYCQVLAGFKDIAKRTVITNFVGSPLVIGLTVLLLALGTGMWGYLAAQIASSVVVVTLLLVAVWKLTPRGARASLAALRPFDPEVKSLALAYLGMSVSRVSGRQDLARSLSESWGRGGLRIGLHTFGFHPDRPAIGESDLRTRDCGSACVGATRRFAEIVSDSHEVGSRILISSGMRDDCFCSPVNGHLRARL